MEQAHNKAAQDLVAARRAYQRDMQWLRKRFGIVPEVHRSQISETLAVALGALEAGTAEALGATVLSFKNLHRSIMREAVWQVLERTKQTLEMLRSSQPELFAEKVELWNRASWLFTNFSVRQSRSVGGNYRKALNLLADM